MAYIIGITGGVGTGKSEVLKIKKKYGFRTIRTDDVAKELMAPGGELTERLKKALGDEITGPDGSINKEVYSKLIYSDSENMRLSNGIIHPAVWRRVGELIGESDKDRFAVETAVPGEEFRKLCDTVWYIHTPLKLRIDRLMRQRGYSAEKCFDIIGKQKSESDYGMFADFIIENAESLSATEKQIRELI